MLRNFIDNDFAGAIADYDECIGLDPTHFAAFINRGAAKRMKGDAAGVIADYDRALKFQPDSPDALSNRGVEPSSRRARRFWGFAVYGPRAWRHRATWSRIS